MTPLVCTLTFPNWLVRLENVCTIIETVILKNLSERMFQPKPEIFLENRSMHENISEPELLPPSLILFFREKSISLQ